jgi:hypothetical protein
MRYQAALRPARWKLRAPVPARKISIAWREALVRPSRGTLAVSNFAGASARVGDVCAHGERAAAPKARVRPSIQARSGRLAPSGPRKLFSERCAKSHVEG